MSGRVQYHPVLLISAAVGKGQSWDRQHSLRKGLHLSMSDTTAVLSAHSVTNHFGRHLEPIFHTSRRDPAKEVLKCAESHRGSETLSCLPRVTRRSGGQDPRPGLPQCDAHALVQRSDTNLNWERLFSEGQTHLVCRTTVKSRCLESERPSSALRS